MNSFSDTLINQTTPGYRTGVGTLHTTRDTGADDVTGNPVQTVQLVYWCVAGGHTVGKNTRKTIIIICSIKYLNRHRMLDLPG